MTRFASTAYKRWCHASEADAFQQLQGASLLRAQQRAELKLDLPRVRLVVRAADVARDGRQILQQRPETVQRRPAAGSRLRVRAVSSLSSNRTSAASVSGSGSARCSGRCRAAGRAAATVAGGKRRWRGWPARNWSGNGTPVTGQPPRSSARTDSPLVVRGRDRPTTGDEGSESLGLASVAAHTVVGQVKAVETTDPFIGLVQGDFLQGDDMQAGHSWMIQASLLLFAKGSNSSIG